ncbi:RsmE family RNA methyltransferase [Treponema sp.]|uniref:RsmE family RNA methyltransferase n=1 Tax=Treponema sp. TaxID=166 RepID=UPI00298E1466|nr:RsmE family RNA methyltransferase [Treponema sp.]MCR5614272.1 16S rRNA (uracil(1498)-N(3))-methyltransferase [Treponema sp.]
MRQFVLEKKPDSKGLITIDGKDFKYIRQVLRLKAGDMIKVSSFGKSYSATLASIDDSKKIITLQLCDTQTEPKESGAVPSDRPEFWLLQFIPKPQKMELIIRQAVECGVSKIIPVVGEYSQDRGERRERIERIIREARQQSGSPVETEVLEAMALESALELIKERREQALNDKKASVCISLYERNQDSVSVHEAVSRAVNDAESCATSADAKIDFAICAVGCEGGISPSEITLLKDAGFSTVHLDVNILRCETASLYGMAVLQTTILENKKWQLKE